MVIPTVPSDPSFWQGLACCDYFCTSFKIAEVDIYKVVGGISEIRHHFLPVIAN